MFEDQIFTGRFAERDLFDYPSKLVRQTRDKEPTREATLNCIRWRVIMDDLWYVEDRSTAIAKLDENGRISRIACRIMKEEVDRPGLFWERDGWHLRALTRMAEPLQSDPADVLTRFNAAFDEYCRRPNSPSVTDFTTFGETFLAEVFYNVDRDARVSTTPTYADMDPDISSLSNASPSRSASLASAFSTSSSSSSMTSSTAPSVTDLSLHHEVAKERIQTFVPKKPEQVIKVEEEDLGWM